MSQFLLFIPGPWRDWGEFASRVYAAGLGPGPVFDFVPGQGFISQSSKGWSIAIEFFESYPHLKRSFESHERNRLIPSLLASVPEYNSVVLLIGEERFSVDRERILEFTRLIRGIGGRAALLESTGASLDWVEWGSKVESKDPLLWCQAFVVLSEEQSGYYSCGMQHFSLPDVEVDRSSPRSIASDLLTEFNSCRVAAGVDIEEGATFHLPIDGTRYFAHHIADHRHDSKSTKHNPYGLWRLTRSSAAA